LALTDKENERDKTHVVRRPESPKILKKIGTTTYEVTIHFSKTSNETLEDKVKRLILNDRENQIGRSS
jgi:hypothetical protein